MHTRSRDGGKYGSRNSPVVVGCAHSDHHSTRSVLALNDSRETARMVSAPVSGRAAETLEPAHTLESPISAISWAAIIGGAFATAALSLILLTLGSAFGLASVSPWPNSGASVTTFTAMTAIWLIIVQWISSGLGIVPPAHARKHAVAHVSRPNRPVEADDLISGFAMVVPRYAFPGCQSRDLDAQIGTLGQQFAITTG